MTMKQQLFALLLALPFALVVGCSDGPAESAGESIDDAAQSVKDTFDPPGPAEKAGRNVDDAVEEVSGN